ncbi:response regulator [uncultured Cyclobacterium sp.]|uniref:response regulator transcription factor n=1 Tax=uncultured Cyclobacterium sp. TaxID=453820 RepID=UPI0030EC1DDE|tara:strand:+ start:79330 stop:79737 length:408 start_codon:yes stop_codon:yes gene_type:complete
MSEIGLTYVVDDDPLYNFGTKKILEITSFTKQALFFLNGEEAWEDFQQRIENNDPMPDVILTDINMPLMNGWQLLDKIGSVSYDHSIKIFVISSSINQDEMDKAKKYDYVSDYIVKPLTLDKVKTLKVKILEGQY